MNDKEKAAEVLQAWAEKWGLEPREDLGNRDVIERDFEEMVARLLADQRAALHERIVAALRALRVNYLPTNHALEAIANAVKETSASDVTARQAGT